MDALHDIERAVMVKGTSHIMTLLSEICEKLEVATGQAEGLHDMLVKREVTNRDQDNTQDADHNTKHPV